ncbi:lipoxygenase [Calothrix sp. FACHB-1219]|uniref:lipoxygenase family protein n=1 Tax=unclassified Calothrix TaxID=2619626 RepID=UPI001685670A|nr:MULTISPECIES: lipoxygenase family protein [unclassified Calothrix]MBD2207412.1 lipoxygenase [Calothrix sp. FACHB-168]MBD2221989.1 lipoxygenase [Calothrix sp. FACHB-1219]
MLNQQDLLLLLYKLVDRYILTQGDRYEYNYNYLNPLAMTDVPKMPLINLPRLPKDELPSREWLLLVLKAISVYNINNTSKASGGNVSFSTDDVDSDSIFLSDKINSLETIEQEINEVKTTEDVNDIAFQLVSTLKEVNEHLSINEQLDEYRSQNDANATDSNTQFSFEEEFQKIDAQIAEHLEENPDNISFDLDSSEQIAIANLKNIIRYNAQLLELADMQATENAEDAANVNFGSVGDNYSHTLEDYDNLFRLITKPEISAKFQQDIVFAYMQVAGPNPVMLKQIKTADPRLPITGEQYQQITAKIIGKADSLDVALQEGRIYLADYSLLEGMANGNFPRDQKYIYAPLGLFAVPPVGSSSRSLIPVAIKIQQALFTPLHTGTWMSAKSILQMADSNYHEVYSHLGQTHLFIEPFVVATNHLSKDHNLRKLLKPHLEGTVLINYGAHQSLVAPKGSVDKLLASNINSDHKLAVTGAQSCLFNFNEVAFPKTLEHRGVNDPNQLPIYPYRDDGMLIWNAIHNWVKGYLSSYYSTDSSVENDQDLQKWASQLVSPTGGRLKNFGEDAQGRIKTLNYLIEAVSTVIFTASAQHAAVNFAQRGLMLYPPAFPLARYIPAPTDPNQQENFLDGLPPLDRATDQINLLYLLGSVYYTKLGDYTNSDFHSSPRVQDALNNFQKELKDIEQQIRQRNQSSERLLAYEYLLPSKIPQSINI